MSFVVFLLVPGLLVLLLGRYCSIQWAQTSEGTSFTVSNNTALVEVVTGLPADPGTDGNCTTDFVVVPNPYFANGTSVFTDRFCGNEFPTVISKLVDILLSNQLDAMLNSNSFLKAICLDYGN